MKTQDYSPKKGLMQRLWKQRWAYIFLLPGLILFFVFSVYPVLETVRLSFYDYTLRNQEFTGFANYIRLLGDPVFRKVFLNGFKYALYLVPSVVILALFIANAVANAKPLIQSLFRGAFYLPTVVGGVVISAVWLWMYHPLNGLFNYALKAVGLPPVMWLTDARFAMPSLSLVVLTWTVGTPIIVFIAGQLGISPELFEAARIDGASKLRIYFRITLPLLKPVIVFVVTMQIIAVFQLWEVVYLLTEGGPSYSTMSMGYLIYNTAFVSGKFGLAAAQGVVLTLTILFFSLVTLKGSKEL